jgi:hypothetical protein
MNKNEKKSSSVWDTLFPILVLLIIGLFTTIIYYSTNPSNVPSTSEANEEHVKEPPSEESSEPLQSGKSADIDEFFKSTVEDERKIEAMTRGLGIGGLKKDRIKMNGKVIGTIVIVKYDQDYENYTIEYYTQDYTRKKLLITDDNFKGCKEKWEFKIGDNLYSLD